MPALRTPLALALLILASPLASHAQTLEITPFAGYRFGGEFEVDALGSLDVEVDDGEAFGAVLGIAVARDFFIELSLSRQETALLEDEGGLFEGDDPVFDLDLDVAHVGVAKQWSPGQARPFVSAGVGITRLSPQGNEFGFDEDERFSASFGGGVKVMWSENLGLRFEARSLWTFLDENDDDFCDDCFDFDDDVLQQGEARLGLILAF